MNTSTKFILIADGDVRNAYLLQRYLREEGFETEQAKDVVELEAQIRQKKPDLLILDRAMGDKGGAFVCQELRRQGFAAPVLMLLGKGDDTRSFVNVRVGANACIRKTQNPLRVFAKIQTLLGDEASLLGRFSQTKEQISFGPFVFDPVACTLEKLGKPIRLTTGDCNMLRALALRPYQPLGRETLSLLARGRLYEPFDRSLDVQLSRLRKLIEENNRNPRYLQTVWGSGYVFAPEGVRQTDKIVKEGN